MVTFRGFTVGSAESVTEFTDTHTVPSGDDRALVFFVAIDGDESLSEVTYNGSSCSLLGRFKESNSGFDIMGEAWYLALGSGEQITTGTLFGSSASGSMSSMVGYFITDLTGANQSTTTGAVAGTQNLGTGTSLAQNDITALYDDSQVVVFCAGQGGNYDPWTNVGSLTDTFDGGTGDSSIDDFGLYLGYRSVSAGTYTVGADGSTNDENVSIAVEIPNAPGGAANATATPALVSATVTVFTATASTSATESATASPALTSASVTVGNPVLSTSRSAIVTPVLSNISVSVNTATGLVAASDTVSPALASVTIVVFQPTVTVGGGINSTASPALVSVSVTAGSPTASVSSGVSVSPVSAGINITVGSPGISINVNATVTASVNPVSVTVQDATATVTAGSENSTATPGISGVSVKVFDVVVTADLTDIFLISPIEKRIIINAGMDKKINRVSQMEKTINEYSNIGG